MYKLKISVYNIPVISTVAVALEVITMDSGMLIEAQQVYDPEFRTRAKVT